MMRTTLCSLLLGAAVSGCCAHSTPVSGCCAPLSLLCLIAVLLSVCSFPALFHTARSGERGEVAFGNTNRTEQQSQVTACPVRLLMRSLLLRKKRRKKNWISRNPKRFFFSKFGRKKVVLEFFFFFYLFLPHFPISKETVSVTADAFFAPTHPPHPNLLCLFFCLLIFL